MKNLLSALLVLAMLITAIMLAACGQENTPDNNTTGTSAQPASQSESETSTEPETKATVPSESETEPPESTPDETESVTQTEPPVTDPPETDPPETDPPETPSESNIAELYPKSEDHADLDFGGKEFKIVYVWAPSTLKPSGYGATYDIFENEDNPDEAMTAAAALRVKLISTYYNCIVTGVPAVEAMSLCNTAIDAGSSEYDLCLGTGSVSSYISGNRYYDVLNLIDTSKDYWDKALIRDLAVGGKLYEITGDMSTRDDGGYWVLFFNKDILAEHNLESPYELVKNYKWTIDKMMEMAAVAATELDGDDVISNKNGKDIFGFITHGDHARSAWIACGLRLASPVQADGHYKIAALDNTNGSDIFQKVLDLMWAPFTGYANKQVNMGVPDGLRKVFIDQRALFYGECLGNIGEPCGELIGVGLGLKDYEGLNFGILPQPMFNEDQGQYYSFPRTACCYGIPATTDIKTASAFVDLWAYHGQQTIQKTYFEQIAYAWTSDAEVVDMMYIITHSAVWDAGYFIDSASLDSNLIADIGTNNNRYSKRLEKGADKLLKSLDKICNDVAGFTH